MKILKNTRFYKWDSGEELEEVTIVRMYNEDTCGVLKTRGTDVGKTFKMKVSEIEADYTMLRPDGYISFAIVKLDKGLEDVMVAISRELDIQKGESLPYAVCRQCVNDIFAKQFSKVDYSGLSISQESCPANVEFENYLACNAVSYFDNVAYYIGDNLEEKVLPTLKIEKFDAVLENLFASHCMYLANGNKFIAEGYKARSDVDGYCRKLSDLLRLNNFEYDLNRAFNIIPMTFPAEDFAGRSLSLRAIEVLSSILRVQIDKTLVVEYAKDIDLKKIERYHCLVSDIDGKVYVVAYTISGKYHVPLNDTESAENLEKLIRNMPAESVQLAYEHLNFSHAKYVK